MFTSAPHGIPIANNACPLCSLFQGSQVYKSVRFGARPGGEHKWKGSLSITNKIRDLASKKHDQYLNSSA